MDMTMGHHDFAKGTQLRTCLLEKPQHTAASYRAPQDNPSGGEGEYNNASQAKFNVRKK